MAVACKNCPCGHIFFVARRSAAALIQNKVKEAEKTHKGPPTPPEPEPSPEERLAQDYGVTPQPNAQAEVQTTNDDINNY